MTLYSRGHDVTVVMPFEDKEAKYNIINSDPDGTIMKETDHISGSVVSGEDTKTVSMFGKLVTLSIQLNENAFKHPIMQEYLKNPGTKFDIVIVQPVFASEAGYYLGYKFKAPIATYLTAQSHIPQISHSVGQPYNPSYMNFPMLPAIGEMTFFERVMNTFASFVFEHPFRHIYFLSRVNEFLDQQFPGEERPSILEIEKNVSLVFQFGHPLILDGWAPMVPNYIQLGMMNCRLGKPFTPGDVIGDFLNKSKKGVIFISFGSNIKGSLMTPDKKQIFLNVFKQFSQYDFIWKWDEKLPNLPKNVLVANWLPQQDILAHSNLKLFITHGGQSSFQESLCYQKAMVVIPVFGDQPLNAKEVKRLGVGLYASYIGLKEKELINAIDEVLHDPKYTESAKAMGSAMNDQITRPLDRAVWWIEHVMRHPNMYAGRSPVHKLTWYQYFLLDVIAFFIFVLYVIFKVFKLAVNICFGKRKVKKE